MTMDNLMIEISDVEFRRSVLERVTETIKLIGLKRGKMIKLI